MYVVIEYTAIKDIGPFIDQQKPRNVFFLGTVRGGELNAVAFPLI
tara:strand:- start:373 stop:507 length:135 start_codon:yes stop_codon:yes gene_type:complete